MCPEVDMLNETHSSDWGHLGSVVTQHLGCGPDGCPPQPQVRLQTFLVAGLAATVLPLARASFDACADGASPPGIGCTGVGASAGGVGSQRVLCALGTAARCFLVAYAAPAAGLYLVERLQRRAFLGRRRLAAVAEGKKSV